MKKLNEKNREWRKMPRVAEPFRKMFNKKSAPQKKEQHRGNSSDPGKQFDIKSHKILGFFARKLRNKSFK